MLACALVILPFAGFAAVPDRLVVTNSVAWMPYAYLDRNNEPQGFLVDLWRLFAERNGIEVVFELVEWRQTLDLIRDGEVHVHGGLTWTEHRSEEIGFSKPLFSVQTLLFRPVGSNVDDIGDIGEEAVGVVAGSYDEMFVRNNFPRTRVQTFPTSVEMARAAFDGHIRFFISDFPTGYYQLVANDAIDRFEGATTLFVEDIHAGVQITDVALLEFIDEGFKRISSEDIAGLRHHWFVPVQPWPNWMMPATATAGLGLLALVLLVHYLTLRRTVMSKTRALDETIRALEQANKELSIRAKMDRLTGLPNRYRFDEVIEFETERATRYGRPLVLALLDLDRFKQINDTHGHPAGDAVLVHLAGIVTGQLRKSDVMVRLGGDEFAIILPEIELDQARPMLERLRREIADNPLLIDGETVKLSVSIGAAAYDRRESVERWIQRADRDLYRHKRLLQD